MTRTDQATYDPFTVETRDDPFPVYRYLREHEPVHRNPKRGFWAIARFSDVYRATRDWRTYANGAGTDLDAFGDVIGAGSVVNANRNLHRRLRSVVRRPITVDRVAAQSSLVERTVQEALDALAAAGGGDAATGLAWRIPTTTIFRILGVPAADEAMVRSWLLALYDRELDGPVGTRPKSAATQLRSYLHGLVVERRRHPREDLLGEIAGLEVDGDRFEAEIGGILLLFLLAATETTASLIGNALVTLAENPGQRARLRAEPKLMRGAVEELLRYEAPIQNHPRITTRPVQLHGRHIPRGAMVLLLYGSANRDDRRWAKPDALDVGRAPLQHLAFGDGVHLCIGSWLARLEARITLSEWLRRFPRYEVLTSGRRRLPIHSTRGFLQLPVMV
jgi:cytochrome P450